MNKKYTNLNNILPIESVVLKENNTNDNFKYNCDYDENGLCSINIYYSNLPLFVEIGKIKKRYIKIAGQNFYSGMHFAIRNKLVDSLKNYFLPALKFIKDNNIDENKFNSKEKPTLRIVYNFNTINELDGIYYSKKENVFKIRKSICKWDLDNFSYPYTKVFQDCLKQTLIPDDNIKIVKGFCVQHNTTESIDTILENIKTYRFDYDFYEKVHDNISNLSINLLIN